MLKTYIIFFCAFLVATMVTAQVEISVDRNTAIYQPGEIIQFNLEGSGDASYRIFSDRFTSSLEQGVINLHSWETNTIHFQASQPGIYVCQVYQDFQARIAAAAVAPLSIETKMEPPADLMEFWNAQLAELASVPIDVDLEFETSTEYSESYEFSLATVNNRRVYGYISFPKGNGSYPAILNLPAFGDNANGTQIPSIMAERGGAIVASISIHNADVNQSDPNAYEPDIITNPDSLYYKLAVLAGIRVIDYIFTLPEFNGQNMAVNGVSQGGGLSMIIAGLDDRVNALAYSNSALCVNHGQYYDQASGFPYYMNQTREQNFSETEKLQTLAATQYVDAAFFAARYDGPSIGVVGYQDTICPAQTVLTAHNALRGPKSLVHVKNLDHSHPNDYWDGRIDFYRNLFPAMLTPPWPFADIKTGFYADAGTNLTATTGSPITLNGAVFQEGIPNVLWEVDWTVEEGNGNVIFSNSIGRTTTATFSSPGTYLLRFTAYDKDRIDLEGEEAKLITISDYIEIVVN